MSILTIENHINIALLSITIAPSTFLALVVLGFTYLYILHVRNNPLPRVQPIHQAELAPVRVANRDGDVNGRLPKRNGRPSLVKRISSGLRTPRQQRLPPRPLPLAESAFRVPFSSLWLPLVRGQQRLGVRDVDERVQQQIQPARVEGKQRRREKQRLLAE